MHTDRKRGLDTKLFEKYVSNTNTSIDVINGLLIAQAICARRVIDRTSDNVVLDIMGDIVTAIETIQRESATADLPCVETVSGSLPHVGSQPNTL